MENINNISILKIEKDINKYLEEVFTSDSDGDNNENYKGEQNSFKKMLFNEWAKIIKWSVELGNNHFAVTINIPQFYNGDGSDFDVIKKFHSYVGDIIVDNFPTVTWFFIVNENNEKQKLHFHAIIAIRNFIDYNYTLKNNLTDILLNGFVNYFKLNYYYDVKVDSLIYFKDIKNWVMYMHKDLPR